MENQEKIGCKSRSAEENWRTFKQVPVCTVLDREIWVLSQIMHTLKSKTYIVAFTQAVTGTAPDKIRITFEISQRFSRRHVKWCPLPKILKLYFFLSVCKCQILGILSIWSLTYSIGQYQGNGGGKEIFLFKYCWFMWHVGVGGGQGSFFSQLKCIDCTPKCRMHTMANKIKSGKTACSLFTSRIHPFAPIYSTILYIFCRTCIP